MNDPIIAEVRRAREQIARECGLDIHKLFELQKHVYDEWKAKGGTRLIYSARHAQKPAVVAEGKVKYVTKKK